MISIPTLERFITPRTRTDCCSYQENSAAKTPPQGSSLARCFTFVNSVNPGNNSALALKTGNSSLAKSVNLLREGMKRGQPGVYRKRNAPKTVAGGHWPPCDQGRVAQIRSHQDFFSASDRAQGRLMVIMISQRYCGPCKMIYPHYLDIASTLTDVQFHSFVADFDSHTKDLATKWKVCVFPVFHFYRNGEKIFSYLGSNHQTLMVHLTRMNKASPTLR
mmetsp:Transcript_11378/g.15499  ORF Transcript_11378/g.15499 Transcript_11378/m.15499 type:complete len:219 (+) Transcript_11378:128-784(+)